MTSAILTLFESRGDLTRQSVPLLIIMDEASTMSFVHFLALATLVDPDGDIMVVGDKRQLPHIVAHDEEDRPPVLLYLPT
jgi:ATP-dependent exoDNAse (exonuclease V) alpha subunit